MGLSSRFFKNHHSLRARGTRRKCETVFRSYHSFCYQGAVRQIHTIYFLCCKLMKSITIQIWRTQTSRISRRPKPTCFIRSRRLSDSLRGVPSTPYLQQKFPYLSSGIPTSRLGVYSWRSTQCDTPCRWSRGGPQKTLYPATELGEEKEFRGSYWTGWKWCWRICGGLRCSRWWRWLYHWGTGGKGGGMDLWCYGSCKGEVGTYTYSYAPCETHLGVICCGLVFFCFPTCLVSPGEPDSCYASCGSIVSRMKPYSDLFWNPMGYCGQLYIAYVTDLPFLILILEQCYWHWYFLDLSCRCHWCTFSHCKHHFLPLHCFFIRLLLLIFLLWLTGYQLSTIITLCRTLPYVENYLFFGPHLWTLLDLVFEGTCNTVYFQHSICILPLLIENGGLCCLENDLRYSYWG